MYCGMILTLILMMLVEMYCDMDLILIQILTRQEKFTRIPQDNTPLSDAAVQRQACQPDDLGTGLTKCTGKGSRQRV